MIVLYAVFCSVWMHSIVSMRAERSFNYVLPRILWDWLYNPIRFIWGCASWTGHPKRVEALRFSKSLCNKLTVTMQPHILYLKIWCYFKPETCSYLLCESHAFNLGLKLLEICLFVSGGSRVEAVVEAVVAEAACTKSIQEITASL